MERDRERERETESETEKEHTARRFEKDEFFQSLAYDSLRNNRKHTRVTSPCITGAQKDIYNEARVFYDI